MTKPMPETLNEFIEKKVADLEARLAYPLDESTDWASVPVPEVHNWLRSALDDAYKLGYDTRNEEMRNMQTTEKSTP